MVEERGRDKWVQWPMKGEPCRPGWDNMFQLGISRILSFIAIDMCIYMYLHVVTLCVEVSLGC